MKKNYSSPILEYQRYQEIDILTASGDALVNDDDITEWGGFYE